MLRESPAHPTVSSDPFPGRLYPLPMYPHGPSWYVECTPHGWNPTATPDYVNYMGFAPVIIVNPYPRNLYDGPFRDAITRGLVILCGCLTSGIE